MPAHGDQHKSNGAATHNPFEEVKPQISDYTAQEIATLQSRLSKRLGPEYISTRAGPGNSRVAYLSAEKAINLANEVFGFNGWSSSIQNIQIDFVDENPTKGTISIGLSVVVRVTLRDGTYHEDTGYGGIENCKSKIAAFEKAKKEGTTDALKRALRNFGNVLGNCIYDKEYITKVSKVKAGQGKFDVNELYRHSDFKKEEEEKKPVNNAPVPQQHAPSLIPEDSFDVNEFDAVDFDDLNPDEVSISTTTNGHQRGGQSTGRVLPNSNITPSKPPQPRSNQQQRQPSNVGPSVPGEAALARQAPHIRQNQNNHNQPEPNPQSRSSSPGVASQHFNPPQAPPGPQSVGFFSARAAEALDGNNNPTGSTAATPFNPYAESPSIRKTSGIDHTKSIALNKNTLKPEPLVPKDDAAPNVAIEPARKVGVPGQPGPGVSPNIGRMTTSAYRPPTRHGPVSAPAVPTINGERALTAAKRAPLSDLSNVQNPNGPNLEHSDAKRQRIGPGLSGHTDVNSANMAPG